ncbi:MAG: hypothetical protein QOG65_2452 [Actinomycetota bacterium]|jgi:hypothetical protein|nr:hypothetical protein [Actinomycetota bacterium]
MAVIECPHCGAQVPVEDGASVRSGHSAQSGGPCEWVMREGEEERHRCPDMAPATEPTTNARRKDPSPRIREAVELVAAQAGCDEEEALTRLRERAASVQYRVHDYALLVIQGMVRFGAMPSDGSASVA